MYEALIDQHFNKQTVYLYQYVFDCVPGTTPSVRAIKHAR